MNALIELSRQLGLGDDPNLILEPLDQLYRDIDVVVAAGARGLELPCHLGCDACCHEAVFLSAPEFLRVAQHLLVTRSVEERRRLVEEMTSIADRFADELELLEEIPAGKERDEVACRVKFRCPLLTHDGTCSVYEARELNARTFGQTWDRGRDAAYGCDLTVGRLRVLPNNEVEHLYDARAARARLRDTVAGTERVHVYPWWFKRHGASLL